MTLSSRHPTRDRFTDVQDKPLSDPAFDPLSTQPLAAHSYRYPPLSVAYGRRIRILVLKPGRPGDPLRCGLKHVNLQQGPIYEALSYTWVDTEGDDSLCKEIFCGNNRRAISITANCEAALIRLVSKQKTCWLLLVLIACCQINQANCRPR